MTATFAQRHKVRQSLIQFFFLASPVAALLGCPPLFFFYQNNTATNINIEEAGLVTELKLIILKMQNFRWLLPLPGASICSSLAFHSTLPSVFVALHSPDPPVPFISCHHSHSLCLVHKPFALAFFTLPARILVVLPTSTQIPIQNTLLP